jgi:pimeloyl-ACP methyl ester carboxylesterase
MKRFVSTVVLVSILSAMTLAPATGQAQPGQSVDLTPCKFSVGLGNAKQEVDARCGVLEVPENRSKPDGRKLDIHFTILSATGAGDKGLPIFHLEGGPGASAIQNFGLAWYGAYRLLREKHDVVLIDQRGTGSSASLQCTEITDAALDDLTQPISDEEDQKLLLERLKACLDRLSATNDPAFYTSTALADDTDAVRAALGYDQIDVFGNSYGTWLGQIYLGRYGQHVHAMVLDSVVGPWNHYLLDVVSSTQASLDRVFEQCQSDAACNKTYPDLPGQFKKALDRLQKEPATTMGIGTLSGQMYSVAMTRSRLLETLQEALYQGANIGIIPQVISQAAQGSYVLSASLLASIYEQSALISYGLFYSVQCSENVPFLTDALIKQHSSSSVFADTKVVENLKATCQVWRSAEVDPADVAAVKSDRPVLILSGAFDPVTPVAYGEEAHQRLSRSTLAVFPYQAHGPMVGSKCAQKMVAAFMDTPDRPVDTACTAQDVKPLFSGAYKVQLVPYSDPKGTFTARVPKDWTVDAQASTGPMTFFASPDGVQWLGVGLLKNTNLEEAQQAVLQAVSQAYGPVTVQYAQTILIITLMQHTLDRPDEVYTGLVMLQQKGKDVVAVWQAAPNNIFQAASAPVAPVVFTSLAAQ